MSRKITISFLQHEKVLTQATLQSALIHPVPRGQNSHMKIRKNCHASEIPVDCLGLSVWIRIIHSRTL